MSDKPYRPCVGMVIVNRDGLLFAGARVEWPDAWQMPQGGIDKGETPVQAAFRELREETGIRRDDVSFLAETADWHAYDFPDDIGNRKIAQKYRGQTQKWVLLRLEAQDNVIDLNHEDVEFSDWQWMTGAEMLEKIVAFKRPIYETVLTEFGLL